ncbi:MAG: hypothetical protein ACTHKG_14205 [Nocardioides sp.]
MNRLFGMDVLLVLLVIGAAVYLYQRQAAAGRQRALEERQATDLAALRRVAEEDVTRFGEELARLDTEVLTTSLDEAARQDYQRALDSYESAKESLGLVRRPEEITHVTEALEDGRYAAACVVARSEGRPLPTRRPPCFFNPAHGPSTTDLEWAPAGGQPRPIPVCAADADRVRQGAEPDIRTVRQGAGRVPYWQGGPAYSPYASGYFGGYAMSGLVPGFLLGSMLGGWDDAGAGDDWSGDGSDAGGEGGADSGDCGDYGDAGGDTGGDAGGWDGGGDFGDFGGFDF